MHCARAAARTMVFGILIGLPGCGSKTETISLSSVFVSSDQKGLQHARGDVDDEAWREFIHFRAPPNIFFVRGKGISEVVAESIRFRTGQPEGPVWLAVFFGYSHSTPVEWTIESIQRTRGKVSVNFRLPEPGQVRTADVSPYWAWIPLDQVAPGPYVLELIDSRTGEITLMRRVEVTGPKAEN
jgi:hypothetical protein